MRFATLFVGLTIATLIGISTRADDLPSFEKSAAKLQAATVTLRIVTPATADSLSAAKPQVTVFSGVSLGNGLVITSLFATDESTIRITIPGGDQAKAHLRVVDEHSGLALLEMDKLDVPLVELAEQPPRVGSWAISAAAWGAEQPLVSFGMVSGIDRTIPEGNYPLLLQCNMTTAETSSGAGIVDQQGRLLGIIVAADPPSKGRGWAYAVPVKHVQRILASLPQPPLDVVETASKVVVLQRRRPTLGMVVQQDARDGIRIVYVREGGPAHAAGIAVGDKIVRTDGIKIRSAYEAERPTWYKQPGDTVSFSLLRENETQNVEVELGGGETVTGVKLGELHQPRVVVESVASLQLNPPPGGRATIGELVFAHDAPTATGVARREPQKLLEDAVDRYQTFIVMLRGQSLQLEQQLSRLTEQNDALKAENAHLRRQLDQAGVTIN